MRVRRKDFFNMQKNKDYRSGSVARFLDELGSSSVSPGGGSAAALCAALGLALAEMVARINDKRAKKKETAEAKKLRKRLEWLTTLDAKTFKAMSKFFKEDRKSLKFQNALRVCAKVPLEICELSLKGLRLARREENRTSRWLASDLAESGVLLEAAFYSARLNVNINLRGMLEKKIRGKNSKKVRRY